ncbi:MAG: extracellular solute-binding protein [Propionibacteriaceae bacterium]|jgi:raffinose/stachyose/melibiose transport system substrate-binding protein|nr:extracellular solute-binding protein [Propionibacteriaceae bacterium]
MKKTLAALAGAVTALSLALTGCSGSAAQPSPTATEIVPRQISWLLSRPADGSVISIVKKLADEYAAKHPGFSLNLITTPDRPSYLQKLQTLAAANQLPELFDTDATPFTQKLVKQGKLVDVQKMLTDLGLYDKYRPLALAYQRFDDGGLYMVPFEFELEFFWYNKALFQKAGVSVPKTLDDIVSLCKPLRDSGVIPISVDGQDGWPLLRYMSYQPFRVAGPDYIDKLKKGEAKMGDEVGSKAVQWMANLGSNKCFQDGFSSQGYTDARDLFTSGKSAMYQIGTWELASLTSKDLPASVRDNVDFFTLPTVDGAVTADNEYTVVSGIGMAVSQQTYDPLMKDFLKFVLDNYSERLAASGHLTPMKGYEPTIPDGSSELYKRALAEVNNLGEKIAFPWDTKLDPTTNTLMQQELTLLVQGDSTPESFEQKIDASIAENAPKFFG